jgi:hypothetical protein
MHIDPAILTPVALFLGALIGGGASVCAAIYTQHCQNRVQRIASEVAKREAVYADFVMSASNLPAARLPTRRHLAQRRRAALGRAHQPNEAFRAANCG